LGLGINIFGFGFGFNTQPNTRTQNPIFSGYKRLCVTEIYSVSKNDTLLVIYKETFKHSSLKIKFIFRQSQQSLPPVLAMNMGLVLGLGFVFGYKNF